MKILIAPDKFKGSMTAREVCIAIGNGLIKNDSSLDIIYHPMADGGDGSLIILSNHLSLKKNKVSITPLTLNLTNTSLFNNLNNDEDET